VVLGAVLLLGVLAVVVPAGLDQGDDRVLHPSGNGPLGAKGLVLLLDDLASVNITRTVPGRAETEADTAVVLVDLMDSGQRAALRTWVIDGGTLLVADQLSPLQPAPPTFSDAPVFDDDAELQSPVPAVRTRGDCAEPALALAERLAGLGGRYPDGGPERCFGDGVVIEALGEGTIVGLASPWPLVNAFLGQQDNAVLVAAVLAPTPATEVAFLQVTGSFSGPAGDGGGGEQAGAPVEDGPGLSSLISDPVWLLFAQLAVAALLVVWWQARRLGRPVVETTPVELDGADLTRSVGRFLERSADPDHGAVLLRREGRRQLSRRSGVPADAPVAVLAGAVSARTGRSTEEIAALFNERRGLTSPDVLALARRFDELVDTIDHPGGIR
jgi:hypothetical protein